VRQTFLFNRIVAVVDGSAASQPVVDGTVALAGRFGCELAGIFVIDDGWPDYIGNDWQSTEGVRQEFLDHVGREQEAQAAKARAQFAAATASLPRSSFKVIVGDPIATVAALASDPATGLLAVSRRVFQVSGRPSLKSMARTLAAKATQPLLLLP
jgi:nucleotide-binding universal stress UspA family protein